MNDASSDAATGSAPSANSTDLTDAASAEAGVGTPLPPLSGALSLVVEQHQGGPSVVRCQGIVYRVSVDLRTGAFTVGRCEATGAHKTAGPSDPLIVNRGKLAASGRARVDEAWSKLRGGLSAECGNDGGALILTLTGSDGRAESWVDQNWGCKKPPPVVAFGARDFAAIVDAAVSR